MAKRQFVSFTFSDLYKIKQQVLDWSAQFNTCCFLDNQQYPSKDHSYECLVAAGERYRLQLASGKAFEELKKFSLQQDDWLFGHFSFDLKSETENSPSDLPDSIQFPDLFFFVPEIIVIIESNEIRIGLIGNHHQKVFEEIENGFFNRKKNTLQESVIQKRISKDQYLQTIHRLQQHILRGDCYEINFCQEFFVEEAQLDPLELYHGLRKVSPSPFSAFYKTDERFLLCASPERYLKRKGDIILSQPIKGTSARDLQDEQQDKSLREELAVSEKDRAENVMVVDLVRNDLSKIC
jgi:para-aminobenzoate synthetase component 1